LLIVHEFLRRQSGQQGLVLLPPAQRGGTLSPTGLTQITQMPSRAQPTALSDLLKG